MANVATIIIERPKMAFRENVEITSDTSPIPGRIAMYTSG